MSLEQVLDHDIIPANLWSFYFTDFPDMQFITESVDLPFMSLEVETDAIGVKHYMGFKPVDSFSVTWRESTKQSVYKYLREWQEQIFDMEKQVFNVGDHSKEAILRVHRFDNEGNEVDWITFSYHHVMLQNISNLSWSYDNGGPIKITATMYCDWIQQQMQM